MYLMIGNDEYEIDCEYEYQPAIQGSRDEVGQLNEPNESSYVSISKVMVDFSEESEPAREMTEIDLPPQVIRDLELEILQEIEV